ncbi:MAG: tRNA (uridine(34)/cytosine(34)/5-carboxymethylaminomethyluridine(34)-2'-O)-methyltransferase TrmL [bacterium]
MCKVVKPWLEVVLYQPEIPPNTGNIIRLAANTGVKLHLVRPLGFDLSDKRMRRAGLDYHEFTSVEVHDSFEDFLEDKAGARLLACSTKGSKPHSSHRFEEGDVLIFGPETRGLPEWVRSHPEIDVVLRLPMKPESRSLNLSNSAAVFVYEAWRQLGYPGAIA